MLLGADLSVPLACIIRCLTQTYSKYKTTTQYRRQEVWQFSEVH